jgi:type II secretory pathway pseudopilin PulG
MIKFFRKIRSHLLSQNRFGKYLIYAIGEIVLVVIGILIALQINTWNEYKKERRKERKILSELISSLENNIERMTIDSINRAKWNLSSTAVINALENDMEYSDTMNYHFHYSRIPGTNLSLSYAGYENLKNVGYDIIESDTLRKSIIELFELSHKSLLEQMAYFETFQPDRQKLVDRFLSYQTDKFDPQNPWNIPVYPHNFEALKNEGSYLAMIKSVTMQRKMLEFAVRENMNATRRVIAMLKGELKQTEP